MLYGVHDRYVLSVLNLKSRYAVSLNLLGEMAGKPCKIGKMRQNKNDQSFSALYIDPCTIAFPFSQS